LGIGGCISKGKKKNGANIKKKERSGTIKGKMPRE
jgi:hypothetical protein